MPNERYLEILVSRAVEIVFGDGFRLAGQQFTLPSGRVDLLLEDQHGCKHLVELKKDIARSEAIEQAYRYLVDFRKLYSGNIEAWVVANGVSPQAKALAIRLGVKTMSIPESEYDTIIQRAKIEKDELYGVRVKLGVLKGGGVQKFRKNSVSVEDALARLPETAHIFVKKLGLIPKVSFEAGKLQVVVIYNGVKVGGVNHLHYYVSSNVVLNGPDADFLVKNGFIRISKSQAKSSHVHVYWKSPLDNVSRANLAFGYFFSMIEEQVFNNPKY